MSVIDVWCPLCAAVRPHAANEALMSCTGCGQIRRGLGEGLAVAALTVAELPRLAAEFTRDPYGSPSDIDHP